MKATARPIAKITRPTLPQVFARPRLFKLLDRALSRPVVWIRGAPGAGKTTLVASYLAARKSPILWYQVDGGDADPATFFYYLGLAAKRVAPRYKTPLPLFTPEYRPGLESFTRRFIDLLCERLPKGCVLVLDNYHAVPLDSLFHEVIRYLFDAIPDGHHVIVISRGDPPLSLARLRASQALEVVDKEALRATPQETSGIANLKHPLSQRTIQALHEMTGGWVAGIILISQRVSLGVSGDRDLPGKLTKEVFDYFAGEIFERADAETQEFLLQTAFFVKMTVPIVEGLTGLQRSRRILGDLVRRAYFIEIRGEADAVYQYHSLFRRFLLARAEETWSPAILVQVRHRAAMQLEKAGQLEDAVELYQAAQDWAGVARMVLQQAPLLIPQGRYATVEGWLTALPSSVIEEDPWLLYWLGICRLQYNPPLSRDPLERAFKRFTEQKDDTGSLLAWSGMVNSILFVWDKFAQLDRWIAWLDERMRKEPGFSSPEIEARVVCDMAHVLLYRQLDHPQIQSWMERAISLSGVSPDPNLRLLVATVVTNYYMWTGQFRAAGEMVKEIQKISRSPGLAPVVVIRAKLIEAMFFGVCTTLRDLALQTVSEGLEVGRTFGIHMVDATIYAQGVHAFINNGDLKSAGEFLAKVSAATNRGLPVELSHYFYLSALLALCREEAVPALDYARQSSQLAIQMGFPFGKEAASLVLAQALHENGEHKSAVRELAIANRMSFDRNGLIHYFMGLLTEAQFAFDAGKAESEARGLKALRKAMTIGREQGYLTMPGWRSRVMARLCMKALEHDIEPDYARSLIRTHGLLPDASAVTECKFWPWPIKIYTLGRFSIVRDGAPLQSAKRAQGKVIEMLKTLIALGGRDVDMETLAAALWPEAEGDKANQAFKTTLHRLRKLLGNDEVISVREGHVTLDPRYCWVDVCAFEILLGRDPADVAALERAVALYHGHFLAEDTVSSRAMALRERLHAKYLRCLNDLGRQWEETGDWKKAASCYQQGLGVDPLVEEYYQRLMICHQQLGHRAEALSVYQRCREALTLHLDIAPSPETEAIVRSIQESGGQGARLTKWKEGFPE
ncbi:MAG: BTAD domain-containing putative transcriptional regulator [Gallionellaceae bacterium]